MSDIIRLLRETEPSQRQYILSRELMRITRANRVPSSVYFEITPLCNFSCKMCYSRQTKEYVNCNGGLVQADRWIKWAEECYKLGTINVSLTGGECLTHPQFGEIYEAISRIGFRVTIMTNCSLFSEKEFNLLREYPPENISITLYGMSESTYMNTVGNGEYFERVMENIEKLCNMNIPITLKATVTKDVFGDFIKMYDYAKERKIRFIYSNILMSNREAHNRDCASISVDNESFKSLFQEYCRRNEMKYSEAPLIPEEVIGKQIAKEKGMLCGAGRNGFTINWRGEMQSCTTDDNLTIPLEGISINEAWQKIIQYADNVPQLMECQKCIYMNRCRRCVFLHYADTHEYGKVSPRLCYKIQHNITD